MSRVDFSELVGKTVVEISGGNAGDDLCMFKTSDGDEYWMSHDQDCCEDVRIESVTEPLSELVGQTILEAYESVNPEDAPEVRGGDSYTWTFYRLRTILGTYVIRWLGESNGYYSESVQFEKR